MHLKAKKRKCLDNHSFGWSTHSLPSIRIRKIISTLGDESRERVGNLTMQARVRWESERSPGCSADGMAGTAGLILKQRCKNQEEPLWLKSLGHNDLHLHLLEESEETFWYYFQQFNKHRKELVKSQSREVFPKVPSMWLHFEYKINGTIGFPKNTKSSFLLSSLLSFIYQLFITVLVVSRPVKIKWWARLMWWLFS